MKKYLFLVPLAILIFLGAKNATAQPLYQTTPTLNRTPPPTPTSGGGFVIPTYNQENFSCPAGLPAGYLTITPDITWMAVCGDCLPTNTPEPLFYGNTPEGGYVGQCIYHYVTQPVGTMGPGAECFTATPVSTLAVIATPTYIGGGVGGLSTSVPTSEYPDIHCYAGMTDNGVSCTSINNHLLEFSGNNTGYGFPNSHWAYFGYTLDEGTNVSVRVESSYYEHVGSNGQFGMRLNDQNGVYDYYNENLTFDSWAWQNWNSGGETFLEGDYTSSFSHNAGNWMLFLEGNGGWANTYNLSKLEDGSSLYITTGLLDDIEDELNVTPVPTSVIATADISDYCGTVSDGSDLLNQTMQLWGQAGEVQCFFIPSVSTEVFANYIEFIATITPEALGEFLIAFAETLNVETQPLTICLQPYGLLPFEILGLSIDFYPLIIIGLVFFVIRHFINK